MIKVAYLLDIIRCKIHSRMINNNNKHIQITQYGVDEKEREKTQRVKLFFCHLSLLSVTQVSFLPLYTTTFTISSVKYVNGFVVKCHYSHTDTFALLQKMIVFFFMSVARLLLFFEGLNFDLLNWWKCTDSMLNSNSSFSHTNPQSGRKTRCS